MEMDAKLFKLSYQLKLLLSVLFEKLSLCFIFLHVTWGKNKPKNLLISFKEI